MKIKTILWGLVWSVLFLFSINFVYKLWIVYPLLSIRFEEPINEGQAETITEFFRNSETLEDSTVSLTFWKENTTDLKSDWGTTDATVLTYYGEGRNAYPAKILEGYLPAARQENQCAVSDSVAWQLWGSCDVLGQALQIDDDTLVVCGVFKSSEHIVLRGGGLNEQYENIECAGTFMVDPVETMKTLIRESGITQEAIYYFPIPWMIAITIYALSPVAILLLRLIFAFKYSHKGFHHGKNSNRFILMKYSFTTIRPFLIAAVAFFIALLLPVLLNFFPTWTTPSQWSDFSYWSSMVPQLFDSIQQVFSLLPLSKDILAKWYILKGCTTATGSLILSITIFRNNLFRIRSRRSDQKIASDKIS